MTLRNGRFGARSTADEVLAGLDLSGRTYLVTGCASGIGHETMRALTARGAHVIGTARSLARAEGACAQIRDHLPGRTTPLACDQDDFASVAEAAVRLRALAIEFDAIIANAAIMAPPTPDLRYGVESQFRVNHLSHMLLATRLADRLRMGSGRLVTVSSSAAQSKAPREGIAFDDLDARRGYRGLERYGQSKLANLAFAKLMAPRLRERGVTSNAVHPGVIASTDLFRALPRPARALLWLGRPFMKSIAQGAATQCYAAAHPDLDGATGGFYADCRPARANPHADDPEFQARLWTVSEDLLARHAPAP